MSEEETCTIETDPKDNCEPTPIPEDGKFRFANQRVHLTYKTHIDKEQYKAWAKENLGAKETHVAHETADKHHPYFHTHIIVEWPKAFQTRSARRFDYGELHPNIKPITNRKQLENAYRYISKEDATCQYLLTKLNTAFAKGVWSCNTLQEALLECQKPSDVLGTIAMFKSKPRDEAPPDLITEFRPWQIKLLNELSAEPDDRHIIWMFDGKGGAGKSRLGRHIEDSGQGILISGTTGIRDIAYIIKTALERGECMRTVMLDLTRSFQDKDIYNVLEMIKNGRMVSGKYESCRLRWKPGHVVVFANFLPMAGGCSADRWRVRSILDNDCQATDQAVVHS